MTGDVFLVDMGLRISQRRKELHMTQEQLADKVGLSLQSISCIELGKKAVRPENLANICVQLDVSSDYILFGKRSEPQMNNVLRMISELSPEHYELIRRMAEALHAKRRND